MKFKAVVTFEVAPNTDGTYQNHLIKKYSEILDVHRCEYSHDTYCDRLEYKTPPQQIRAYLRFEILREINHLRTVHYLSQILEGYAGILSAHPDVYSFSYSICG